MTRRVVLYIDSLKTGGAERVTLLLARWLVEAGWQATVLTRHGASRDFYPVPAGVQRSVEPGDPIWLRRFGPFGFPLRMLRLRAWLQRHQPDLVLGMTTLPAIKLLLAVRGMACPCIVSERNFPFEAAELALAVAAAAYLPMGPAASCAN